MKVTLINTSDVIGGAAIAAKRLTQALISQGIDVKLLVQEKKGSAEYVYSTTSTRVKKQINFIRFAFERFLFYLKERDSSVRFAFSIGNVGENVLNHKLIKEADIIHLHWINGSFLSLKTLKKLFKLGKPIVWTFHDMWAFTGGCHYAGDCENFKTSCQLCPFLKNPGRKDLSYKIWKRKEKIFNKHKINVVTCSNWLKDVVLTSSLLKNQNISSIQNPIDLSTFKPKDKEKIRKSLGVATNKKLVLFGAMNTNDKRKGSEYLMEALNYIGEKSPEYIEKIALLVFGKNKTPFHTKFETLNLNFISKEEEIIDIYNACDVFVTPSLEDNLPNTIVEAHSCGVPVVAFNATGMREMINHKENGYLANYKSIEDLANGITWTLFNSDYEKLCISARNKAIETYSSEISANKYIELYKSLLEPDSHD